MIDFTLTPSQRELQHSTRTFAQTHLSTAPSLYSSHADQRSRFESILPLYRRAVCSGLVKAQIPIPFGGTNGSLIDAAIQLEELYAVETSVSLTIFANGLGLTPLILAGSEEQRGKFLEPFLREDGEPLASLMHSEPGGTANWLEKGGKGLQTTARREDGGDGWVINGEKLWTTNSSGWDGKGADLQCVVCRYSPDGSPQDPSADPASSILILIVTREVIAQNPPTAYTILSEPELAGHVAVTNPHTRFTNFRVPESHLLCLPGTGAAVVEQAFTSSAALVGAMAVGLMRAAFEAALKFAKADSRGGANPIIYHQSVADLLMDMKMKADSTRLVTWKALHCLQSSGPEVDFKARFEGCLQAKIFGSEAAVQCVTDGMKVVGMTSYNKDQPFSRLLNDAICLPLFDGGNVGIRRRQMEKIFQDEQYKPWVATYGA
ncbi:hypothetical protein DTO164E3_6544 [Paecilomyces variotii]|nr:hypothetical protein DTO164E3_6544 [Paecilomyces variotii]KAJ9259064.1 hypothetical protein DTO207G8_1224 [Paecilomyces variotii]